MLRLTVLLLRIPLLFILSFFFFLFCCCCFCVLKVKMHMAEPKIHYNFISCFSHLTWLQMGN